MKLFWIPLKRIMLSYCSFNWNLWVKGSVGVDSSWACISSGKDGMVLVRMRRKTISRGYEVSWEEGL